MILTISLICALVAVAQNIDENELLRLENVWNAAHVAGDAKALAAIWGDDLIVSVPGMRVMNKAEALSMLEKARMKFDKYDSSDIRVRVYGDAAVVTGRIVRNRVVNNTATDDDWRFTKTYIRRGGAWQVVAFHASPAR